MSAWSHLPNAAHIDRVITSLKSHPDIWNAAYAVRVQGFGAVYTAARTAARTRWVISAAYDAAWDVAWNAIRDAASDAASDAAYNAAYNAAWGAILALVVYDAAKYLAMPGDSLKTWALLSEDPAAILLLPAVIAFEQISESELV